MKADLPANCGACAYRPPLPLPGTFCRRHAPSPGQDEFDIVHWPKVRPTDRCGDGAQVDDVDTSDEVPTLEAAPG
jgi:hypothetical protein